LRRLGLILIFALINFGGLALGGWLMGEGPSSDWYISLQKAPWTPPGWVFGFAWTTIMICFSIYLGDMWSGFVSRDARILFTASLLLNIVWNYLFFNRHWMLIALISLSMLTLIIWTIFFRFKSEMNLKSLLLLPYMIWLLVAVTLNTYAVVKN
jgi:tryptophan-rich sensory protein